MNFRTGLAEFSNTALLHCVLQPCDETPAVSVGKNASLTRFAKFHLLPIAPQLSCLILGAEVCITALLCDGISHRLQV
jgi:hypothetical protein